MGEENGGAGALSALFQAVPPNRRRQFRLVALLMLAGAVAELATIAALLPFLTLLARPDAPGDALVSATILLGAAALITGAVRLQLAWTSQSFAFGLGHEISVEIQRRVLGQPYSWHIGQSSRRILASLEKVQILASSVALQLVQALGALLIASFILAALIAIDPPAAILSAAALALLYFAVSWLTRRRLARNSGVLASAFAERIGLVQESLGGIRDVILDQAQALYLDAFRNIDLQFSRARATTAFIAVAPRFAIEGAGIVLVAAAAILLSEREGGLAPALPVLGALALGAQRLLPLVQQVYHGWSSFTANRAIASDILNLLRLSLPPAIEVPAQALPLEGEIRLDEVGFSYPGRSEPALSAISLAIRRGERVAIVGPTGSGKSTLADLIMGLLQPDSGRVTVDGASLEGPRRAAWWLSVAHVPQSIFLADSSIARNIAFGCRPDRIDPDRVAEAARRAQLAEFVASLPDGFETQTGERGVRLSGGQRQRLGIARALYKGAPVLVLDEATSALDEATEAAVLASLGELAETVGLTVIVIAHRQSTIAGCDRTVRIEAGRLAFPPASP